MLAYSLEILSVKMSSKRFAEVCIALRSSFVASFAFDFVKTTGYFIRQMT